MFPRFRFYKLENEKVNDIRSQTSGSAGPMCGGVQLDIGLISLLSGAIEINKLKERHSISFASSSYEIFKNSTWKESRIPVLLF